MWTWGVQRGWLLMVGLVFGLLWACNPFATRTPEEPEGVQIDYFPTNIPENVLKNLKLSCEHRRATDYMSWLTEEFLFEPDPSDVVAYEDELSEPWDWPREEAFVSRWLDKKNTRSVQFTQWDRTFQETVGEEEHFEYDYVLIFEYSGGRDAPARIEGKGHFYLKVDEQGQWAISRWVDEKKIEGEISSWGELRARF